MKQFLVLLHEDVKKMSELSPKEMEELANAHMNWAAKLAEKGHFISGDGLHEKGVLITGKDSVVKDGPYLESKEIIGGVLFGTGQRFRNHCSTGQRMSHAPLWWNYRNPSDNGNGGV